MRAISSLPRIASAASAARTSQAAYRLSRTAVRSHTYTHTHARRFASQPSVAEQAGSKDVVPVGTVVETASGAKIIKAVEPAAAEAAAAPAPAPAPTPAQTAKPSTPPADAGSAWQRFVAFVTGMGVASVYFYYTISDDVWRSTARIEKSMEDFRGDVAKVNRELRQRIAALEHELAAAKK